MRSSPLLAPSLRLVSAAFISLALMLCLASIAFAQTSSDAQYGSPTESGEQAIESAGGAAAIGVAAPSSGGAAATGVPLGVLPDTGGSSLVFLALGVLSLGAVILLVLRQFRGGQS